MPDYAGFLRIGKMVSVLVSVADSLALKPLLHTQFGLEARVGIEPRKLYRSEPNTLCYRAYYNLILLGVQADFSTARSLPIHCPLTAFSLLVR